MNATLRSLLVALIALSVLAYFPVGPAGAFGMTQMTICGATGAETIWLDADGNPTEAPQACDGCLDCMMTAEAGLPPQEVLPPVRPTVRGTLVAMPVELPRLAFWRGPMPRGPPSQQPDSCALARSERPAPGFGQGPRNRFETGNPAGPEDTL